MKRNWFIIVAALLLAACEKSADVTDGAQAVRVRFSVEGDFTNPVFTRASNMTADGAEMTDLWVFDYVDGVLVQQLHQTPTDDTWGAPVMSLAYGSHHVYFVASRGKTPTADTSAGTIEWERVGDTFWTDYAVDVTSTTAQDRTVTLNRVATKLRVTVKDEVPAEAASLVLLPTTWYHGINYTTGAAIASRTEERTATIPDSYVGTSGSLSMYIYGMSGATEWTTDFTVSARDADNDIIGTATVTGAPFVRNRATVYSGNLFGAPGSVGIVLSDTWEPDYEGTW